LIELNRDFHERVNQLGASTRLSAIVDNLFLNPMVRVTDARDRFDVLEGSVGRHQITGMSPPTLSTFAPVNHGSLDASRDGNI